MKVALYSASCSFLPDSPTPFLHTHTTTLPDFSASSLRSERQRMAVLWWAATALWYTTTFNGSVLTKPVWKTEREEEEEQMPP